MVSSWPLVFGHWSLVVSPLDLRPPFAGPWNVAQAGVYDIEVAIKYKQNIGNFVKKLIYFWRVVIRFAARD